MYTIPIDFELDKLNSVSIIQVSFSLNSITIFFEKLGFITINGSFAISFGKNRNIYSEIYPIKNDLNLLMLLEKKVLNVFTNEKRDILTLEFEKDIILELIGNDLYECYFIKLDNNEVLV